MSKRTTIRIPDDLYIQLAARAKNEQRTVSNMIVLLLNQALNVATNVAEKADIANPPHHKA
jgi:predicted CopG family antitoxin